MPIVNGHRRLLSAEAEKQLKTEMTALWNSTDPIYKYEDIAKKLKFGVPDTPYENLRLTHVVYYCWKFKLTAHLRGLFITSRRLLMPKAEKKLKSQLKPIWEQRLAERNLSYKDIADKLQFGVPGTPYEKLKNDHVLYYAEKFGFEIRHIKPHHYYTHKRPPQPNHSEPQPLLSPEEEKKLRENMRPLYFAGFTATKIAEVLHITEKDANFYLERFFHPHLLNRIPPPQYISSLKTKTTKTPETPEMPETDMLITVITK